MPKVAVNGVHIHYESFGEGPALLLIMGIGAQMVLWDERFCHRLAGRGYRVVRFDNRDVGESTWLDDAGVPKISSLLARSLLGLTIEAPYDLSDMALDVVGLIDALDVDRAHVVGASMGGMIAQTLAIEHPDRLHSMTSMMSTPGGRRGLLGKPGAMRALLSTPPRERQAAIDHTVELLGVLHGSGIPYEAERVRALVEQAWDRGSHPAGFVRQLAAILSSGSRRSALRGVSVPTLSLHGSHDPLIPLRAGRAVADLVPNARFEVIRGMGHGLAEGVWDPLIEAIATHAVA